MVSKNMLAHLAETFRDHFESATEDKVNKQDPGKRVARTFTSDDTLVPTEEMWAFGMQATSHDDADYDPITGVMEALTAKLAGKEAALFMPTEVASNQIALRAHLEQPPFSILSDYRAQIYKFEAASTAIHSGATVIPVIPTNGHHLTLADIKKEIMLEADVVHYPTQVVTLENTLDGVIFPQDEIIAISNYIQPLGIKMHLDGGRLWHAAIKTDTSIRDLCAPFDSVTICFNKGLAAPMGSCLVGSKELINRARTLRNIFGANIRRMGFLAAVAGYAVKNNVPLLPHVHYLAKKLEAGLKDLGVSILSNTETYIVSYDPSPLGISIEEISNKAMSLKEPLYLRGSRLVVHIQTSDRAVDDFLGVIRELIAEKKTWNTLELDTAL